MPTVLRTGPHRFYFYSHEPNEPPHVHVGRDNFSARFWLNPVGLARNLGFNARELRRLQSLVTRTPERVVLRLGVGILAPRADGRVSNVEFTADVLSVALMDGRAISVPLVWYPRLLNASEKERHNWQVSGGGYGIHLPVVDEDLSTEGLLRGAPALRQPSGEA